MSINLIESVRQHLAYTRLQKVSPNSQGIHETILNGKPEMLDQASISAVLAALYQFTRDEEDAVLLLRPTSEATWLEVIFRKFPVELEDKISAYTGCDRSKVKQHLLSVAQTAVEEIQKVLGKDAHGKDVKHLMTTQRNHILSYLPGDLTVGKFVNNSSLDDVTNKMHGPFSDFMHWIEEFLAEPQKPLY